MDVSSMRNGNVKPVCAIEFDYRNLIVIIKADCQVLDCFLLLCRETPGRRQ